MYILDLLDWKWKHVAESKHTPWGRQRHSAIINSNMQIFIFGGFDGNKWLNDSNIFDASWL